MQENLPATYLEHLMVPLRKAGLVQGVRGANGGDTLGADPAEISVLAILEVLEGLLTLSGCPGVSGCCGEPATCALHELWAEGSQALSRVYQHLSLAALLQRQQEKEASPILQ